MISQDSHSLLGPIFSDVVGYACSQVLQLWCEQWIYVGWSLQGRFEEKAFRRVNMYYRLIMLFSGSMFYQENSNRAVILRRFSKLWQRTIPESGIYFFIFPFFFGLFFFSQYGWVGGKWEFLGGFFLSFFFFTMLVRWGNSGLCLYTGFYCQKCERDFNDCGFCFCWLIIFFTV